MKWQVLSVLALVIKYKLMETNRNPIYREIRIFFTSLMFFTRIPCPKWTDHSEEYLTKSSRYFSLVGIIVGGISALAYYLAAFVFPHPLALLLSIIAGIFATGAFHEDGLADVCDGFGGGWKKETILRIMKDSCVGTYGVIGLLAVLSLKCYALYLINPKLIPLMLIAGHALSRFTASTLLYTLDYVRDDNQSKARSAAQRMSARSLFLNAIFGLTPLFFFRSHYIFILLIPVFVTRWYLVRFFVKWIGGQTGDCLGATQQFCEVVFYLAFMALWKFI
jgi:adenosylcobinamide-GDP ribazoletransferase